MFKQIIMLQHCVIVSLCSYCCCCSGFCTDNTDASLLRWFLEYIKIFTLHSRWKFRGFSSSAEYQSQSYTKGASSLKAKKKALSRYNDGRRWLYIFTTMTLSGFHVTTQESFHYNFRGEWFSDWTPMIVVMFITRLFGYFIPKIPSSSPWIKCQF